jgi:hypothetical protein
MSDKKIELSLELVNAILTYLGGRPYVEVAPLVNEIHAQGIGQISSPEPVASEDLA